MTEVRREQHGHGRLMNAFIDPAITTRSWFTKSSGRLEPGKHVRWDWEMCPDDCVKR